MKIAFVTIVALVAMASAKPAKKQDSYFPTNRFIVGGVPATPYEFPHIVDMRLSPFGHWCAGSIISPEWVVTAAHCSDSAMTSYTLTAGEHNITSGGVEGTEQVRQVVKIISPLRFSNDIALMMVDPPFDLSTTSAQAVVVPDVNFVPTSVATVAGWGVLTEDGAYPDVLMKVDVPFVDDATCNANYAEFGGTSESMICYGEAGKDSCQADSGGPIMCGPENALCGIVSFGNGCARPGFPGVYTETSYFADWIREMTTPTAEDPEPATTVTNCGGMVESTSAAINFNLGSNVAPNQKCAWVVKAPYDQLRMQLVESGLTSGDGIYVTEYNLVGPGRQVQITTVGEDVMLPSGMYFLTFIAEPSGTSQGFSLEFYSSGYLDSTTIALSGFAHLTTPTGSHSYPVGGGSYQNNENAVFIVNPEVGGDQTLTFTRVDIEDASDCGYDALAVYTWTNNQYTQSLRFCGTTMPNPFPIPGGLSLVTFTTDSSITATGFDFSWA
ncbi:Trypsin-1 [Folsomia candida]|uniref:Trypsin-1 n=1 Tax=Folsomia candida TaxID=158441 RepID=A0A226F4G1_FOLCA|nr:Trypsin-1 [Folsomia candida]